MSHLDVTRPHAIIYGVVKNYPYARYEQDGRYFDSNGESLDEEPSEKPAAPKAKPEPAPEPTKMTIGNVKPDLSGIQGKVALEKLAIKTFGPEHGNLDRRHTLDKMKKQFNELWAKKQRGEL